ncbi:class I SAM-dependent methyltransferase [Rhodoblastus sp.]|uniref:class I SAM-dependent methyltransferase n=1 Tax=Rhodoblastus sp. TaxID=1962975 RepID=UPI00262EA803|nr:class I SAM-dependent methyltransferase [Rhodoblastus sp.]
MTESETAASKLFDRDAQGFDDLRRRLIPCFDDFYGTALKIISDWRTVPGLDVLDIGAGTGLFSAMVSERFPVRRLCLLDCSSGMLEQARARFAGNSQVEIRLADMSDADLGGPWDLVISALAIHHLPDDAKRDLYRRIRYALKPGGLFVNAEQVAGPNPVADQRYSRIWLEQIRALGVSELEIDKARERMSHDRCAPVEHQLRWLADAGFADVDCSFKAWRFAVLSGRA